MVINFIVAEVSIELVEYKYDLLCIINFTL